MIRTQINLPESVHRDVKRIADIDESTIASVIRKALEGYIGMRQGALKNGKREWAFPKARNLGIQKDIEWSKTKDDLYARDPFKSIEDQ